MLNYFTYKSMKNMALCALVAVFFVFVGCKQKDEDTKMIDITADNPVAKVSGNDFEFLNKKGVHEKWENIAGDKILPEDIVIKKVKAADGPGDYYVLLGMAVANNTKIAVLLEQKGDELYFAKHDDTVIVVKCTGCKEGCDPLVVLQYGAPSIICSPCPDCLKQDVALQ